MAEPVKVAGAVSAREPDTRLYVLALIALAGELQASKSVPKSRVGRRRARRG